MNLEWRYLTLLIFINNYFDLLASRLLDHQVQKTFSFGSIEPMKNPLYAWLWSTLHDIMVTWRSSPLAKYKMTTWPIFYNHAGGEEGGASLVPQGEPPGGPRQLPGRVHCVQCTVYTGQWHSGKGGKKCVRGAGSNVWPCWSTLNSVQCTLYSLYTDKAAGKEGRKGVRVAGSNVWPCWLRRRVQVVMSDHAGVHCIAYSVQSVHWQSGGKEGKEVCEGSR